MESTESDVASDAPQWSKSSVTTLLSENPKARAVVIES